MYVTGHLMNQIMLIICITTVMYLSIGEIPDPSEVAGNKCIVC